MDRDLPGGTTMRRSGGERGWSRLGLFFALVACASAGMVGLTSFTSLDPPDWLRIATMAPLPFALAASAALAAAGLRRGEGRGLPVVALLLDGLCVAAVIAMVTLGG